MHVCIFEHSMHIFLLMANSPALIYVHSRKEQVLG